MVRTLRDTLWILALAVILMFVFFVALGAFDPGEVMGVTAAVAVLVVAWIVHAYLTRGKGGHDPTTSRARERRGF